MSVNKVFLIGNVGKDPEVRVFEDGGSIATFSLATTERGYKKQDGTVTPDITEWHRIVASTGPGRGGLVKIVEEYIKKGSKLHIEGKLRNRSWDKEDGTKAYVTEVLASNIELLDTKKPGVPAPSATDYATAPPTRQSKQPATTPAQQPATAPAQDSNYNDEELPF